MAQAVLTEPLQSFFVFFCQLLKQTTWCRMISTAESGCRVFSTPLNPVRACQTNVICRINHKSKMIVGRLMLLETGQNQKRWFRGLDCSAQDDTWLSLCYSPLSLHLCPAASKYLTAAWNVMTESQNHSLGVHIFSDVWQKCPFLDCFTFLKVIICCLFFNQRG